MILTEFHSGPISTREHDALSAPFPRSHLPLQRSSFWGISKGPSTETLTYTH